MRKLKFRGKSFFEPQWWEGYYVYSSYDKKHYITQNSIMHGNLNQFVGFSHYAEINPKTLGEYTGFKDKNKKEIYEGDVYSKGNVVEFSFGSFNINGDVPLGAICSKIEIIGNIYDNPELK